MEEEIADQESQGQSKEKVEGKRTTKEEDRDKCVNTEKVNV